VLTWFLDGYHRKLYPGLTHGAVKNMLEELGINPVPVCDRTSEMANIARKMFPVVSCSKSMMPSYAADLYEINLAVRIMQKNSLATSLPPQYVTQSATACILVHSRAFPFIHFLRI